MMIALRSPIFSPIAPNSGWPMPQNRFWIAIANENSARSHWNSVAMGIWNTPKDARTANEINMIAQPATKTVVIIGARVSDMMDLRPSRSA